MYTMSLALSENCDVEEHDGRISINISLAVDNIASVCYLLVWFESVFYYICFKHCTDDIYPLSIQCHPLLLPFELFEQMPTRTTVVIKLFCESHHGCEISPHSFLLIRLVKCLSIFQ